jgi:FkbM family methyltransferase
MKFKEKIKKRLDLYLGLIRQRKEIKSLYYSLDKAAKKDFRSILKFNLIRYSVPYFLSKILRRKYNFYNSKDKALIFKNYIFKSVRIKQDSQGSAFSKLIQEISFLIKEILITKAYEDEEVKVEPKDIVLDCGANIGIFSIYAAKKTKMVYAFEPSQDEAASLSENMKLNNCNNIKIVSKAVFDTAKNTKLILFGTTSHFIVNKDNEAEGGINIETIPIDEFVREENLNRVDFIKMNIEGSEEKAFLGAKETLRKFKPKLAISVAHKFDDLYKLPLLIKRLNPDYKIRVKNKKGILMLYAI